MNSRPSRAWLMFRMFCTIFVLSFLISRFWNTISGMNMLPLKVVFWVSVVLTTWITAVGWTLVTAASKVLMRNDVELERWKLQGGRPYWDSLGWPINTATEIELESKQDGERDDQHS